MEKSPEILPPAPTEGVVEQKQNKEELSSEKKADLALIQKIVEYGAVPNREKFQKLIYRDAEGKLRKDDNALRQLEYAIIKGDIGKFRHWIDNFEEYLPEATDEFIQEFEKYVIADQIGQVKKDLLEQLGIPKEVILSGAKAALVARLITKDLYMMSDYGKKYSGPDRWLMEPKKYVELFGVPQEFVITAGKEIIEKQLSLYDPTKSDDPEKHEHMNFGEVDEIIALLDLPSDTVVEIAQRSIINRLADEAIDRGLGAIKIKEWLEKTYGEDFTRQQILENEEVKLAARGKALQICAEGGEKFADHAEEIISTFSLTPEQTINNKEFKEAFKIGLMKQLKDVNDYNVLWLNTSLDMPEEIFKDPEVLRASKERVILLLQEPKNLNLWWSGSYLSEAFFSDPDIQKAAMFQKDKLIEYVEELGAEEAEHFFPVTLQKARETISEKIATDIDLADWFVECLPNYGDKEWVEPLLLEAVKHYSVAKKFLDNLQKDFKWKDSSYVIDAKINAEMVVEQWNVDNETKGHQTSGQGFSENDPYKEHPYLFTAKQIQATNVLFSAMTDKNLVENEAKLEELGVSQKMRELLFEINRLIDDSYIEFMRKIDSKSTISKEDRNTIFSPEYYESAKLTPLSDNVRRFIARYISQKYKGNIEEMNDELGNRQWLEKHISGDTEQTEKGEFLDKTLRILEEGFKRYIQVCEVDIPLYDKLYKEFDELRETGRNPLEVYLGRDGIYAYIGRRSQDVARRRKLGPKGRKELREKGEILEIHPKYLVYPRYFRDYLDYQTKREFLEQEGISPEADPLFYDTGYTGTIPEQIMKVMDFENDEIEKRIRLLSAPSAHRRVKGIPENARSEIIEYIEHNAKLEESAKGLLQDEKTGKIRHIAQPTTPEEQFYFMMIKQAIARHYWLQERLHHEPSGYVNRDSEHYGIRIKEEYLGLLPEEFVQDPKKFFTEHGELLKGSKGKGEYPDEEIILFKLQNGAEIVAKRIELRKAKEARKEFGILIAARKENLPTADPVGFLSGKEEEDGSYLLMGKVEGISGRKFKKYLQDSGKYTPEQTEAIMKTVAEKNREMTELFRDKLKIDKRWRIKDTIIRFDDATGEVESVIPIDWERAIGYDPDNPKEIDQV